MKYLNLGCGSYFNKEWVNVDIQSNDPDVIISDLTKGIPFSDNYFDVVYHSNVIEHFRRNDALLFMKECFRVLKPGGVIRVATPDLEVLANLYLEKLDAVKNGDFSKDSDYEWILLEMYDQTVRENSGGQMITYLRQNPIPNEIFVLQRIGKEGQDIIDSINRPPIEQKKRFQHLSIGQILSYLGLILNKIRYHVLARLIIGSNGIKALEIGQFRLSGELHQWMYDQYSMKELLKSSGFKNPIKQSATDSIIPEFGKFYLDVLPDGSIRKPDSFYMEATRPNS